MPSNLKPTKSLIQNMSPLTVTASKSSKLQMGSPTKASPLIQQLQQPIPPVRTPVPLPPSQSFAASPSSTWQMGSPTKVSPMIQQLQQPMPSLSTQLPLPPSPAVAASTSSTSQMGSHIKALIQQLQQPIPPPRTPLPLQPSPLNVSADTPIFDTRSRYIRVFCCVTYQDGRMEQFHINVKGDISALSLRSKMKTSLGKGDYTIKISSFDEIIDPALYQVRIGHNRERKVGGGLENPKNWCFMNAALQSLFYMPVVFNYLQNITVYQHTLRCTRQLCILCPLVKVLEGTLTCTPKKPNVKAMLMYQKLKVICSTMQFGRQEDSHEFLM